MPTIVADHVLGRPPSLCGSAKWIYALWGEVCEDGVVFDGAGVVDPSGFVSTCSPYLTVMGLVTLVPASRGRGGLICINMEGNLRFVMRNLRPWEMW